MLSIAKIHASVGGHIAQTLTTAAGMGVLSAGVAASVAAAPATEGASVAVTIPAAMYAAPQVNKLGGAIGDLAQNEINDVFSRANQPKISYTNQMIASLPKMQTNVRNQGIRLWVFQNPYR